MLDLDGEEADDSILGDSLSGSQPQKLPINYEKKREAELCVESEEENPRGFPALSQCCVSGALVDLIRALLDAGCPV